VSEESRIFARTGCFAQQMLRGVYPERKEEEILRSAQNDQRRAQHDRLWQQHLSQRDCPSQQGDARIQDGQDALGEVVVDGKLQVGKGRLTG